jgi:hypothetical protein
VTGSAWQLEVVAAGQSQVVGGIGSGTGAPASALPLPFGAEPELAHAQPELSSVHVKPAPQSASALQGASYLGTHSLCVVGWQAGGAGQPAPGGQDGAGESQPPTWDVKQTMPVAQSLSALHGPGTQDLNSCVWQSGAGGQS